MESNKVCDEENHSCKDQGSIEDIHISAVHWIEFNAELKLQYFVTTAGPTQSISCGSEPSDYFSLIIKAKF